MTFLVLTFIRIGIAYLSGYHGTDITDHLKASRGLLQGQSLYFDVRFDYVPLHAYLQAFFLKLLGDSVLSSKLPALIGDIGFAIVFYLIGKEVNENFGRKLSLAYLFLPLSIITSDILGLFDSMALFLMSLGVYFTLKSSQYLGSVFIGLGTMYKFLPILSVIPIWIVDFCEKRYRQIFFEMTIICAIIAVLFGPYLLTDSSLAIESVFFNGTKIPDSFSLFSIFQLNSEIIPFILQIGLLSIFFYTVIIHFNLFPANSYCRS